MGHFYSYKPTQDFTYKIVLLKAQNRQCCGILSDECSDRLNGFLETENGRLQKDLGLRRAH